MVISLFMLYIVFIIMEECKEKEGKKIRDEKNPIIKFYNRGDSEIKIVCHIHKDSDVFIRDLTEFDIELIEEKKKQELMKNIVVDMLKKAEGELDEESKERLWEKIKKRG